MIRVITLLHSLAVVHSDVKEDNWVLNVADANPNAPIAVCIIDFGLAKVFRNVGEFGH